MRIKMKEAMPVTVDGVNTVDAEEGDELDVGDGVGADLVAAGHAKSLDPDLENKDAGAADENKAENELLKQSRADLNAAAAELGIENADEMANKQAVAAAILEAKANAG